MKKIMILGASILQLPAIKKAKEMGLEVVVVDMNPDAVSFQTEGIEKEIISTIDIPEIVKAAKRHVIFAVIALPIVLVVCIIFGALIWLEDRGTIFYLAKRRGKDGTIFNMYKLRSMKVNAPDIRNKDNSTFNSADDPRVTKIGKLMRKISVDELPQVFNILKGDMSWIGPRPVTTDRPLSEYDQKRKDRLKVKPGITGYTQAYYRNNISQEDKLALDAKYAQKVTFLGDLKIFFKTIETVVCRKNVYTN